MTTNIFKHLYVNKSLINKIEENQEKIKNANNDELHRLVEELYIDLDYEKNVVYDNSMQECLKMINELDEIRKEIEVLEKLKYDFPKNILCYGMAGCVLAIIIKLVVNY